MQTKANTIKIIDVSHWQTVNDWQQVKDSGVDGVYLKASQGTWFKDATFLSYVLGAQSVGLLVGAYHYAEFTDPIAEAANFLNAISGVKLDLIPVLDAEEDPTGHDITQWTRAFISATGLPFMFYSYTDWLQNHPVQLTDLPLWIADYRNIESPPDVSGWTEFSMWQYSQTGTVPGINGNGVDLNAAVSLDAIKNYEEDDIYRTTISGLNLRVAPGTDFGIRAILPAYKEIHITKLYGGWAYTPDGHQWGGWVSRKYLTKTESEK